MSTLAHGDFELNGYKFSGNPDSPLYVVGLGLGVVAVRDQDVDNPVGDGRIFGQDRESGPTWAFEFRVGPGAVDDTLAELARVTRAWRTAPRGPGQESVLRYAVGNRTRRIYGRPRSLAPDPTLLHSLGYLAASGEFVTADGYHYADEVDSVRLSLIPGNAGGLVSPLVSPLTTVAGGQRQGIVQVAGDASTPMEITFYGPITNPGVSSTGWSIRLNASLAYDQSVTLDTRRGTVRRNDGANLAGSLSRTSYLPDAQLRPGNREIIFTGTDATGTSSCAVSWRPAYYSF